MANIGNSDGFGNFIPNIFPNPVSPVLRTDICLTLPFAMPLGADLAGDPGSFSFDFYQTTDPFEEKYGVF